MQLSVSNFLVIGLLSLILSANALPAAATRQDMSQRPHHNAVLQGYGLLYGTKAEIDIYTALTKIEKRAKPKKPKLPPINTSPGDSSKPPAGGDKKKPKKKPDSKSPKTPSDPGSPKPPKTPQEPGSPQSPKTPETAPPSASPKESIKLGKCGSKLPGKLLTNEAPRTPKSPKTPKTPVSPKGPAPGDESEDAHGNKDLTVCPKQKPTKLIAPTYPNSGDIITRNPKKWEPIIKAFNAANIDPCENDYTFRQVSSPTKNTDGLWTPEQASKIAQKDSWDAEHIMDVQAARSAWRTAIRFGAVVLVTSHFASTFVRKGDWIGNCAQ
jgi:hypothetical protein